MRRLSKLDMQINPFSSRFTNPSNCQFVSPATEYSQSSDLSSVDSLARKFLVIGGFGKSAQIVGPHGCGKSTLAVTIGQQLLRSHEHESPINIRSLTLRKSQHSSVAASWGQVDVHEMLLDYSPSTSVSRNSKQRQVLIVDGIELLSPVNRRLMLRQLAGSEQMLLLTTHRRLPGVEVLANLCPQIEHFRAIVQQLLTNCEHDISDAEIANAFEVSQGDYRLALRMLYDQWQMNLACLNQPAKRVRGNDQYTLTK